MPSYLGKHWLLYMDYVQHNLYLDILRQNSYIEYGEMMGPSADFFPREGKIFQREGGPKTSYLPK